RFAGAAQSLLRIVAELLFVCHGTMKIFVWFGGLPPGVSLSGLVLISAWIELVGGSLVLLGLLTRPAAFLCSGEMAVAYFIGHFPHGFWPIQNHGEPAVLYCFIFLFFAAAGAGPFSVDAAIARARHGRGPAREPLAAH